VIEDCAHALGGTLSGKPLGTFGHAAFLSFEAGRPVNTYGGGMVVSNDAGLIAHVRHMNDRNPLNLDRLQLKINTLIREQHLLRSGLGLPLLYGFSKPLSRRMINRIAARQAAPSEHNRYAPVQALLGLKKLPHVEENCARRAALAQHYDAVMPASVLPQARSEDTTCTHAMYVVRCPQAAERIRTQLLWRGIDAGVGDEIAHDVATPLGYGDCPHAARLAQNALALPIFEDLTEPLTDRVVDVLRRALER
jgi:dTDP-4-amino-4,6-dideoxygalactose transaminase